MKKGKIEKLKAYFQKQPDISLAFLFGSQSRNSNREISDWDIAVYFKSQDNYLIGEEKCYSEERKIWDDLEDIVKGEVDFVVLNRAPANLVFDILNSGEPLIVKNQGVFLDLLLKSSSEAVDFYDFCHDYYKIYQNAKSLTETERIRLERRIIYLENEMRDFLKFEKMNFDSYKVNISQRRETERWIENLINAMLDISKIILASQKKEMPQTYKDTILELRSVDFPEELCSKLSNWVRLRNILAHEYLDILWRDISDFLKNAKRYVEGFLEEAKRFLESK